jgi:hypothetical protein
MTPPNPTPPRRLSELRELDHAALITIAAYLMIAYLVLPQLWSRYERKHPDFSDNPRRTHTAAGIPGDPLNICIVGTEADIIGSMTAAGWDPADLLTFRTSVRIAVDTMFRRPDGRAPVSNLFLFGRREDLAFEKQVGRSPKQRHHVRFWLTDKLDDDLPVWIGSAAFDIGVELSRTTGQVTHHIAPDLDTERDLLVSDLQKAGKVSETKWIDGFQPELHGRNGGGDLWHTDGKLAVATLSPAAK